MDIKFCEKEKEIIRSFGKLWYKDLTPEECDVLLEHSANCEICKKNAKALDLLLAKEKIDFELDPEMADLFLVLAGFDPPLSFVKE